MDYEKKYNEALAWMRELYPGLHGATKEDAEHYFPELAESEDERIRKVIYKLMLGMREEIFTSQDEIVTKEKVLVWLEKQKEQKPADLPAGFYVTLPDGKKYYTKEMRCNNMKVKVVTPQPLAWSEEDKSILEALIYDIERLPMQGVLTHRPCDSYIKFLKSLRPDWKPTEDQMNALNFAITYFMHETNYKNPAELRELYEDLLKLK